MKAAHHHELIDVHALRVGMFVLLDGGWMSHPFPLSSFRLASPDQIATIASLGLKQVRWDPLQSDADSANGDADAASGAGNAKAATISESTPAPLLDEEPAERARREQLEWQRESLRACERQFGEAARELKLATELVQGKPREACTQAEALATALVNKMIGEHELCVRLLTDRAGDKAATHALNVTILSLLMGRSLGLPEADMQDLGVGAMLHDIGKLDLPERLRHHEDRFSPSEVKVYQEHVAHGMAQGHRMGLSPGALQVVAQHHELADGSGFPAGLNTDRMSAPARIVALVNRYDKLCNPNLSARALTPHESLALLFAQDRSRLDASILGAFIKMMGVYPAGSTVQLTDDRYAMVMSVNASRPLKPCVLVHDEKVPREQALLLDLQTAPGTGIRRSIKPMQLPPATLEYLSPRQRVSYFFEPARDAHLSS